jgi:hypothetical protein
MVSHLEWQKDEIDANLGSNRLSRLADSGPPTARRRQYRTILEASQIPHQDSDVEHDAITQVACREDSALKSTATTLELPMPTKFPAAVRQYTSSKRLSKGTKDEYKATVRKWLVWDTDVPVEELSRASVREFLDWVYETACEQGGTNPERTANKAREHLRAVVAWAWENDIIETLPRFPKPRPQRNVAGRHYLTKAELNAIYFATHYMKPPRGWAKEYSIGLFWRSAIPLFFNYGLDTGTIWQTKSIHEPILWRHVYWDKESPDRQSKARSRPATTNCSVNCSNLAST